MCLRLLAAFCVAGAIGGCANAPTPSILSTPAAVVWRLDNMESVGGQKPEILGAPRLETAPGGQALVFDGAHDGLIVPVNPIAGWRQFTIEVLFAPAVDGAEAQRFFHIQDTAGRRALLEIRLTPGGRWSLDTFLLDGASSKALNDPTLLHSAGQWHWVALRYDGRRLASFVDGQPQLEGDVAFAPMDAGQTSAGVRLNKVYWFKGAIREIRFSSSALPPAQLQKTPGN